MTKELHRGFPKAALMKSSKIAVLPKCLQHNSKVLSMLCGILCKDQNAVKENDNKLIQVTIKHFVHRGLKCGRCIGKPKWHNLELVGARANGTDEIEL